MIKRYTTTHSKAARVRDIYESPNGEFVSYEDHQNAVKQAFENGLKEGHLQADMNRTVLTKRMGRD